MKILIVDDQQLVLLPLQKGLTDLGYEVTAAANVLDAIGAYDAFGPDLVITDINMPFLPQTGDADLTDINEKAAGLEIVKYIRSVKKQDTPIMMLSGNVEESVFLKSIELGANDYVKKPLKINDIGARVKKLMSGAKLTQEHNFRHRLLQTWRSACASRILIKDPFTIAGQLALLLLYSI